MRYANDMIPYTFTRAFALSFTERRRAKNMAISVQHATFYVGY